MSKYTRRGFLGFIPVFVVLFINCSRGVDSISAPELETEVGPSKAPTPHTPPEDKTVVGALKKKCPIETKYKTFKNWKSGKDALFLESFGSSKLSMLKYFVNGVECIVAMNFTSFDLNTDELVIKEYINGFWQEVYSWPPSPLPAQINLY